MKEIILTCPFTGLNFKALETADKDIIFNHAITGEPIKMNFNNSINKFNLDKKWFKKYEIVSNKEAADILEVSLARITQYINENVIPYIKINGKTFFLMHDVLEYKNNRKIGAPTKEQK